MKVLYIVNSTVMGGATISFFNMVLGVMKFGVSPVVIGPGEKEGDGRELFFDTLEKNGIKYYESEVPLQIWPMVCSYRSFLGFPVLLVKFLFNNFLTRRRINRIVSKENPDLIHTNVGALQVGFEVSERLNIPHIWHIREYQDEDFKWKIFPSKKRLISKFKRSSSVVAITKDLLRHFELSENSVATCIYNGILSRKDLSYMPHKKSYFLCASRIDESKGHKDVIIAFSSFVKRHPDYELVILGFGSDKLMTSLKQLARDLGCSENIRWEGYKENVTDYMKEATALLVGSYSEGFGRMTAEACMLGCIPIGRNTAGTKEIIQTVGGFCFETNEDLADCMDKVASMDEKTYANVALPIQRKAIDLFSIEANVDQIYDAYRNVLDSKRTV